VVAGGADAAHEHAGHGHIHMPSPSYFPIVAAAGLPLMGYGAVYENAFLLIVGGLIAMFGLFGWAFEPGTEE
jgi:cytochrome c oxidase subunit 1